MMVVKPKRVGAF